MRILFLTFILNFLESRWFHYGGASHGGKVQRLLYSRLSFHVIILTCFSDSVAMCESDDCLLILRHSLVLYPPLHNGDINDNDDNNNDNDVNFTGKSFPLNARRRCCTCQIWSTVLYGIYIAPYRARLTFLGHQSHQLTFSLPMSRRNVILLGQ